MTIYYQLWVTSIASYDMTYLMMDEEHTTRLKRLLYRSTNRGWKETDLLIGEFAKANLDKMDNQELDDFEALLQESDPDVFGWMTGKQPIPAEFDTAIMKKMRDFKLVPVKN